ncbi:response regulator [Candidatus Poribacteria bacterium]|nr:response regulator [Candidatus Poribacteria bacterium]
MMAKALRILIADDEQIVHQTISAYLSDLGHNVDGVYDGISAISAFKEKEYDLAFVDIRMPGMTGLSVMAQMKQIKPDMAVVIITGHGNMDSAIQSLRLGALDFLTKPVKLLELDVIIERLNQIRALQKEEKHLRDTIRGIQASEEIRDRNRQFIGKSKAAKEIRQKISQAVEANCDTILITGETGTGKEVVAREIHFLASPEDQPFIAVSCPALPESLVESELFGHIKGAFTGATSERAGYFELANGGTLFLDEIADLSKSTQATMLRVLETRTLRRIGGSDEIKVNLRIIAATNTSLKELTEGNKFRSDLFYRLDVFSIYIPPLKERREDIIPLAQHFLTNYTSQRKLEFKGFTDNACETLLNYDYPGNARELRNIVERAAIIARSGWISPEHMNMPVKTKNKNSSYKSDNYEGKHEHEQILKALDEAKWNRREAAKILDMPYSTLRYKMQKFGIS